MTLTPTKFMICMLVLAFQSFAASYHITTKLGDKDANGVYEVVSLANIEGVSMDKIWAILNKPEKFSHLPYVDKIESLGEFKSRQKVFVRFRHNKAPLTIWNVLEVSYQQDQNKVTWTMLDGSVQSNRGQCVLSKQGSDVLLEVKVAIDVGLIPKKVVAWFVKKHLPDVLKALLDEIYKTKSI